MTICERHSGGRILCIRLSGLGDVVHALNALTLLRRERPDAHVAWLVEERFAGLLRGHPYIDELLVAPRRGWGAMLRNPLEWRGLAPELYGFAKRLRGARYDVSVDFQSSLKSALYVAAAWAPMRVGFDLGVSRELNWTLQNERVRAPRRGVHRIERDIALLAPLGIRSRYAEPLLPVGAAARAAAARGLEGRLGGGPLVIIHPGTSRFAAFKRWAPERYARVADGLIERRGADVVVTCGPEDRDVAAVVTQSMRRAALDLPPTRDLQELAALLARADLFIGSDTGPLHVASALGVPAVALFGPKDPDQTGPYCSRSVVVTGSVPCRPCSRRRCPDPRCMSGIHAGRVLAAALRVLDGGGEQRGRHGLIRKPFTRQFALGGWRGRIATAYSYPEFYTRLCEPDELVSGRGRSMVAAVPEAPMALPLPRPASERRRLIVERRLAHEAAPEGALFRRAAWRSWRRAHALLRDGVRVPFPVCLMERDLALRRDTLALFEDVGGAVNLRELLRRDGATCAPGGAGRRRLIESVAGLVRALHGAGYCCVKLGAESVLVRRTDAGDFEALLCGLDAVWSVRAFPLLVRDVVFAAELGRLAQSLGASLSTLDAARFLRCYWRGLVEERHRRRLYRRAFRRMAGRRPAATG